MPTYAYACTECDHRFDLAQSFAEDPLTICPECEGRLRKVYGSIGITFKGSGFYRTDSRTTGSASASSGNGGGSAAKERKGPSSPGTDAGSSPSDRNGSPSSSGSQAAAASSA